MLQLQLQIFAICLSLVSLLFFCRFVALSLFIFAQSLCCSPKQMLPATDFHYTHTHTHTHTRTHIGASKNQQPQPTTKRNPFGAPFATLLRLFLFRIIGSGYRNGALRRYRVPKEEGGSGGYRLGVTLRKYVTAFVTHFRVNFLLHPT